MPLIIDFAGYAAQSCAPGNRPGTGLAMLPNQRDPFVRRIRALDFIVSRGSQNPHMHNRRTRRSPTISRRLG